MGYPYKWVMAVILQPVCRMLQEFLNLFPDIVLKYFYPQKGVVLELGFVR